MHDLMKEYEFCRDLVEGLFDLPTEIKVRKMVGLKSQRVERDISAEIIFIIII